MTWRETWRLCVVLLACMAIGVGLGVATSERPQIDASRDGHDDSTPKQGAIQRPAVPLIQDGGSLAERDAESEKTQHEGKMTVTDWLQALSAVAVAFFTIRLWAVANAQHKTLEDQRDYMRDGLAETKKATAAATVSAEAAKAAAELAEAQIVSADRPYVMLFEPPRWEEDQSTLDISFKNFGRGPAMALETQVNYCLCGGEMTPQHFAEMALVTAPAASVGTLAAGSHGTTRISGTKRPEGPNSGCIFGQFNYSDIFGNRYHPRFCVFLNLKTGQWSQCPRNPFTSEAGHGYQPTDKE